jgi:hypothetical protein
MSYEEFYDKATKLKDASHFHFIDLFSNNFFALGLCIIVMCFAIIIINANLGEKKHNIFLQRLSDEWDSGKFCILTILLIISFILSIIFCVTCWIVTYNQEENLNKTPIDNIYTQYMEEQDNIKLQVNAYITDKTTIDNMISNTDSKDSYIFPNIKCINCIKQTILFKINKKDSKYTKIEALVSYSLAQDAQPYLEMKPQIRESVAHISKDGWYNPVLYLPASLGGIVK